MSQHRELATHKKAVVLTLTLAGFSVAVQAAPTQLEVVKKFPPDFNMIGVGVSYNGTVFASAPATIKRYSASVVRVDAKTGALIPFPNAGGTGLTLTR